MSKPLKEWTAVLMFVLLMIFIGITAGLTVRDNKQTRRCIVESRNSVEVPEVCK